MTKQEPFADQMPPRRFEYKDDRSYKFWAIELDGDAHTVTFGRIGTKGQTRTKQYDDAKQAQREYQKRIDEKLRAGYREVEKNTKPKKSAEQIAAERAPHEPFLEAIIEADDDDLTPHLIYSDWLTERGDPLGEFIQVQLQLEDPNLPLRRRPELEKRETQLLARHVRSWLGELAPFLIDQQLFGERRPDRKNYEHEFRRGQLESIRATEFDPAFGSILRNSWRCPLLKKLSFMSTDSHVDDDLIDDDDAYEAALERRFATLAEAQFVSLRSYREWNFGNMYPGDGGALCLPLIATMERLQHIEFGGDFRAEDLAGCLPSLKSVKIGSFVSIEDAHRLVQSGLLERIKTLELRPDSDHRIWEILAENNAIVFASEEQ